MIVEGTFDRAGAPSVRVRGSAEQIFVEDVAGVDVTCASPCAPDAPPTVEVTGDRNAQNRQNRCLGWCHPAPAWFR